MFGVTINPDYIAENRAGFTDGTIVSAAAGGTPLNGFAYIKDNLMNFCPPTLSIDIADRVLVKAADA